MKSQKKRFGILFAVATLAASAAAMLFSVSPNQTNEVEAATVQTHRRLYAKLQGAWDNADHMYIHYWGGTSTGTTWASCPEMTNVISDYWQGLYYYDVPVDITDFLVKDSTGEPSKVSNKSADITVASLFVEGNYQVCVIGSWVADNTVRAVTVEDNAPMSSLQATAILNNIDSCDSSYAGGYNAWPQLNDLFISPSALEGSTVVTDNFGPDTTIALKTAFLQAQYNEDQGLSGSADFISNLPLNQDMVLIIVVIGLVGVSSLAGLYILRKKRA